MVISSRTQMRANVMPARTPPKELGLRLLDRRQGREAVVEIGENLYEARVLCHVIQHSFVSE